MQPRKRSLFYIFGIVAALSIVLLLQTAVTAGASSQQESKLSDITGSQTVALAESPRQPEPLPFSPTVLPERFVLGENDGTSAFDNSGLYESRSISATSAYPGSDYDMVGKVPWFAQDGGGTCGAHAVQMVLWWFGENYDHEAINDYIGKDEGPYYLRELEWALEHFLGMGYRDVWCEHGGFDDAEDAKEYVKYCIYSGWPVIACIHAPGSDWWNGFGFCNHYVTIVGWDDNRGCWCINDSAGFYKTAEGHAYDVWHPYSDFDEEWDNWWTSTPGSGDCRGIVVAHPGDGKWVDPYVQIVKVNNPQGPYDLQMLDNETIKLEVNLWNAGDDASYFTGPNGVFIRFPDFEIVGFDKYEFLDFEAFDHNGNSLGTNWQGSKAIQLNYNQTIPISAATQPNIPFFVSAYVWLKDATEQTSSLPEAHELYHRSWMTDQDDFWRRREIFVDDDTDRSSESGVLGVKFNAADNIIVRAPWDFDNVGYEDYEIIWVQDDDYSPPSILPPWSVPDIYDNFIGANINFPAVEISDERGISEVGCGATYGWASSDWSSVKLQQQVSWPAGTTHWVPGAYIPYSEWVNHVGQTLWFYYYAIDDDNDVPNDRQMKEYYFAGPRILDDDTDPPGFLSSYSQYIGDSRSFRIGTYTYYEKSGFNAEKFRYRFDGGSWSSWEWAVSSGPPYVDWYYDIPYDTWSPYSGQTIYWQMFARDADNDRPGDMLSAESDEFSATLPATVMRFVGQSPINILVTDPNGLHVGYDPVLGQVNEIPLATYSGEGTEPQEVRILNPATGTFRVDSFGTGSGAFTITIESLALDGSLTDSRTWTGTATPGEQYTQQIQFLTGGTINEPPVADAGPNQVVERTSVAGTQVLLDGSGSSDPDNGPQPLSYSWTWAGGGSANGVSPTVTMPMGTTIVTLEVSDGSLTSIDQVDITVQDTTPPLVNVEFPTANLAVQDGITLQASATDVSGVAAVYFYIREPDGAQGKVISAEFEDLPAILNSVTGKWEYNFDTLKLPDGNYIVLAKGVDTYNNEGWSATVPFSIRNWAVIQLLPSTPNSKAGRTMPVKFALRVAASVDPAQPFVWNDELTIKIFATSNPGVILQTSTFGSGSRDYRVENNTLYITNFQTSKVPIQYTVEIWRTGKNWLVGSFTFKTVK